MIKIAVDLDGADKPCEELLPGAIEALNDVPELSLVIAGQEEGLKKGLEGLTYDASRVEFLHCSQIVTNLDDPLTIMRNKKDSSLVKLLSLMHDSDQIQGFVSCGSTGSIMIASLMKLGRINSLRPALATVLPKATQGLLLMCDCGANSDCTPDQLVCFAKMANAYVKNCFGIDQPRVALLSNGAEEKKGNELVKNTHMLLKETNLNFVGNVEGSNLLNDTCDVLVTDGFSGNVVLKNVEGTAKTIIKTMVKQAKTCEDKTKQAIMMEMVQKLMATYDFNTLGGAILLGVPCVVIKGHGAGNASTISHIISQCYQACKTSFIEDLKKISE